MSLKIFAAGVAAVVATTGVAQATTVITPTVVGSSGSYSGYPDIDAADQGPGSDVTDWASASQGVNSFLNLDLGALYTLAGFTATDRVTSGGINGGFVGGLTDFTTAFTLQVFTDATFLTPLSGILSFNHTAPVGPTQPSDFAFTGGLGNIQAQYVQYHVTATSGANPGLSNINFTAVPEPATWGMMLIGFGLAGGAMRSRRKGATQTAIA